MSSPVKAWFLAARPKTLVAAVLPVLVTTAYLHTRGYSAWLVMICALLASLLIQVGTNFINDAKDFEKGADTETRLGPQRATQMGWLTKKQVLVMGGFCFLLALLSGAYLVYLGGYPILAVGVLSLLFGYCYTGGPFPLAYHGLGDIFVFIFFGLIAVNSLSYIVLKEISLDTLVLGAQLGALCTVLITINNLRDVAQDKLVNKKTLAVIFGSNFVRGEIIFLYALTLGLQAYWWNFGIQTWIFQAAALFLMIRLVRDLYKHEAGPIYNSFLARASLIYLLYSLGFIYGFVNP